MRGSARNTRARTVSIQHLRLLLAVLTVAAVVAAGANVEAASLSLTWSAPTTSADGTPLNDLASYRIYLGTAAPACPSASYHTVSSSTSAPASGQTASTLIAGLSAGTTFFARVTAVDDDGNESGCTGSASGVAQADFTATPAGATGFGTIAVNGTVDRTFTVQNTGTASLSVTASVGSPFSIVSGGTGSLGAGASRTVTVRFRPTAVGSFASNVSFTAGGDTLSRAVNGTAALAPTFGVTVTKNGTGAGTVTSSTGGISCGSDCTDSVAGGAQVTLSASASSGSTFAGWGGACSGTGACALTVTAATTVTATFNKLPAPAPVVTDPAPTTVAAPTNVSVTAQTADATGVTFNVAWGAASGATSYRYGAGFNDGSAGQQGTVTGLSSFQLRMPYHASSAPFGGYVCVRSIASTGLQSTGSCSSLSVPARPPVPVPVAGALSPSGTVAGDDGLTLTVNGSGFVATSVVRWNAVARPTTVVSSTQLQTTISAADLANPGTVPVTVFTPAPGGGTSASQTFTIATPASPAPTPAPSTLPGAPGNPIVKRTRTDTSGATFSLAWTAGSGATSYRYVSAFGDGSARQEGAVSSRPMQLRMPYHRTGGAFGGFVCIRGVNAAGQLSLDHSCAPVSVPAR